MAFRADEAAPRGYEHVEAYFVPRPQYADESVRAQSREALMDIVDELGPVVDTYPTWHPLVCHHDSRYPEVTPNDRCGYKGLDHTRYFLTGFITCPYTASGKADKVIESVNALPPHPLAHITAEKLDVKLYNPEATPVLVKCNWDSLPAAANAGRYVRHSGFVPALPQCHIRPYSCYGRPARRCRAPSHPGPFLENPGAQLFFLLSGHRVPGCKRVVFLNVVINVFTIPDGFWRP